MGSCNCQEVTWKCKAMRLVVFTVTQLTFPSFHFSFNELLNFTCWVPYQYYSSLLVHFYLFHFKFLSLKINSCLFFQSHVKGTFEFSTKRFVAVPHTGQNSSIKNAIITENVYLWAEQRISVLLKKALQRTAKLGNLLIYKNFTALVLF